MPTIFVDGKPYDVEPGKNLLHVCLSLGMDLPYFCWHPAMHSVGACRQCAVKQFKDENDAQGRIVMACMTAADDGVRISIDDPEARAFRAQVIEWLMIGHPHDCPVCDEGGECHLQDMTVMTGHNYRRYRFRKRTFRNQELGPFLNHEMNRCIACYRCVRFYRDYAGGRDLDVLGAHHEVYFGRHADGVLENEFSGNLVEVCPTGVFTDKTLKRHYARKWDLATAPSVCVHCATGCNTLPGARYDSVRRIRNRYHEQINGYFLCDRGRYGHGFINAGSRVRASAERAQRTDPLRPSDPSQALAALGRLLGGGANVIGIGSPRASIEANFVLRTLVGADRFYSGMSAADAAAVSAAIAIWQGGPLAPASLLDAERSDAALILGEDVPNTAPRLALALRQAAFQAPRAAAEKLKIPAWHDAAVREAIQDGRGPCFVATPCATRLDPIATRTLRAAPADIARVGFAVAHALREDAPPVPDADEGTLSVAGEIARALRRARRPIVVAGAGCGTPAVMRAAANIAWALYEEGVASGLFLVLPECDSMGAGLLGAPPLEAAFRSVADRGADAVIVLENDLYRRARPGDLEAFLSKAARIVVLDHTLTETAQQADLLLAAATYAESTGTLIGSEGRAQRHFGVLRPGEKTQESWRWLRDILHAAEREEATGWRILDDVTGACAAACPPLRRLPEAAPAAAFRICGRKVPREPLRFSGRTVIHAGSNVHDPQPPEDGDSPFSYTMEGYPGTPPPALIPRYWKPGWNSVQALNRFQEEVGGPLRGTSPGVRLFDPSAAKAVRYAGEIPPAFPRREDAVLVVPLHEIFGSEELSPLSDAIAARAPGPYVALRPDEAQRRGLSEGATALLALEDVAIALPVRCRADLPPGVAGVPAGMTGAKGVALPAWGTVAGERSR